VGHIDAVTGGTKALQGAAQKAAESLLQQILSRWQGHVAGPQTVALQISGVSKTRHLRQLTQHLRNAIRGVQDVRQRSFRNKVAEIEIEMKGSPQDLALELEEKQFPGFQIEINEITANKVVASMK
jgi:hypothetical protein